LTQPRQTLLRGRFLLLPFLAALLCIAGCQPLLKQFGATGETLGYAITPSKKPQFGPLLPGYEYLLAEINGRQVILVLGQRKTTPSPNGDVVDEHWYSASREMMHLRNGRLHVIMGMHTEWRDNRSTPPAWSALQAQGQAAQWLRTRDEMPYYRFGIQDSIRTQALAHAPIAVPAGLPTQGHDIRWAQDHIETTTPKGHRWVYTQNFALAANQVIYSEQCISPELCLRLQRKY
jgi:hypothetical protein